MNKKEYTLEIGDKKIIAEFTDLANQANGSVVLRSGNTVVLATAVMSENPSDTSWFPLRVDYEERFYAAGQILGSRFIRREGRPSEEAILSGRVIDRTIRPLFDQKIRHEIQVVITILSIDEDDPDILAINAASLALATSNIPWAGPVSAVRVGKQDGTDKFRINPQYPYRRDEDFSLDLLACGKEGKINMIEVGAHEENEEVVGNALKKASDEIEKIQGWQKSIVQEIGKQKQDMHIPAPSDATKTIFKNKIEPELQKAIYGEGGRGKMKKLDDEWKKIVKEEIAEEEQATAREYLEEEIDSLIHRKILSEEKRPDGRKLDQIRNLYAQAGGISETLHGSGMFYRGGTHILSVLTLGGPDDSQIVDGMEIQKTKRFFHHYNFPPFSSGETGRVGGFNRRMIGHGALAEKALRAVLPSRTEFPYTIRIVSEALASNGSTSMGSVCASSLALMDAGVPIKRPVAGIAMGLVLENEPKNSGVNTKGVPRHKILTDIQGYEDHHGDMDLKVAGTREGVTAMQMDVKVEGVPIPILIEAFQQARNARLQIISTIEDAIEKPRESISRFAPHIEVLKIEPEQIGLVIGSGGKTINDIKDISGAEEITIEDDGTIFITAKGSNGSAEEARKMIESMTRDYTAGEKFEGEVTRILDFGAFVKIGYNTEGLVHISEIAPFRIEKVSNILSVGDKVPVQIKNIDEKHRINLSLKDADSEYAKHARSKEVKSSSEKSK